MSLKSIFQNVIYDALEMEKALKESQQREQKTRFQLTAAQSTSKRKDETIASLEEKVSKLEAALAERDAALAEADSALDETLEKLDQLDSSYAELQRQTDEKTAGIDKMLQGIYERLQNDSLMASKYSKVESERDAWKANYEREREAVTHNYQERVAAEKRAADLERTLLEIKDRVSEMTQAILERDELIKNLEAGLKNSNKTIAELQGELQDRDAHIEMVIEENEDLVNERCALKAELEEAQVALEQMASERDALQCGYDRQLEEARQAFADKEFYVKVVETERNKLKAENDALTVRCDKLSKMFDERVYQEKALNEAGAKLEQRIKDLEVENTQIKSQYVIIKENRDEYQNLYQIARSRLDEITDFLDEWMED